MVGKKILCLVLICTISLSIFSRNYYVSTSGADSNPGTPESPYRTISRAASRIAPGDTVFIRGGVYREPVEIKRSGTASYPIVFTGYEDEEVIITGTDVYTDWTQEGEYWKLPWTTPLPIASFESKYKFLASSLEEAQNHPNPNILRREMVIFQDTVMMTYSSKEDLVPGSFWVEGEADNPVAIWAKFPGNQSPDGKTVECSVRGTAINTNNSSYIHFRKLTLRHCATYFWKGALTSGAGTTGNVYEDIITEWNNNEGFVING